MLKWRMTSARYSLRVKDVDPTLSAGVRFRDSTISSSSQTLKEEMEEVQNQNHAWSLFHLVCKYRPIKSKDTWHKQKAEYPPLKCGMTRSSWARLLGRGGRGTSPLHLWALHENPTLLSSVREPQPASRSRTHNQKIEIEMKSSWKQMATEGGCSRDLSELLKDVNNIWTF